MRLWTSSSLFPQNRDVQERVALPCVVGVVFDAPSQRGPLEGQPITCGHCGAALNDPAAVARIDGVGPGFQCAFCRKVVVLRDAPNGQSQFATGRREGEGLGPVVVAAIDTSGSMAGGSLDAVRQSILTTIIDLGANAPETRFGLVTFSNDVSIFAPGPTGALRRRSTEKVEVLARAENVRSWALEMHTDLPAVSSSFAAWNAVIAGLFASGSTALGPGLVAAAAIVEKEGSARVILLTDGCANLGVGTLGGPTTHGRAFYGSLATDLARAGIVVDLVAVAGEGKLELSTLRALPEVTGGELFYVDKAEVGGAFKTIGAAKVAARKAHLRVVLPQGVRVAAATGIGFGAAELAQEIPLGSVAEEREIYFAIEPESALTEPVPVQVQLRYVDERGEERLEVKHAVLQPTGDVGAIEQGYDPGPFAMMEVQRGGEDALAQGLHVARARLEALRGKLANMKQAGAPQYVQRVTEELNNVEMELQKQHRASYADSSSAASYAMAKRKSTFYSPPKQE